MLTKHEIASRIYTYISDQKNCANNWGVYIFSVDFDNEPELRNKASVMWLAAILDVFDAEDQLLAKLSEEKNVRKSHMFQYYIGICNDMLIAAKRLMSLYNKDQQIIIQYLRNQFAHAWLTSIHNDKVNVRYLENGKLLREKLSHADYHKIGQKFLVGEKTVDEVLLPISEQIRSHNRRDSYPYLMSILNKEGQILKIGRDLYGEAGIDYQPI